MKKFLLAGAAIAALTTAAAAADLPRKTAPMAPLAVVPTFTWTGFYVGVNAGYGFSTNDDERNGFLGASSTAVIPGLGTTSFFDGANSGSSRNRDGFVGGGQVGFNYQFGAGRGFVIGIEADYQYADFGRNNNDNLGFVLTPAQQGIAAPAGFSVIENGSNGRGSSLESFGTVRARVGYAFDRVLVYATGGLAFTVDDNNNRSNNVSSVFFTPVAGGTSTFVGNAFSLNGNNNGREDVGFTVGGGVEYAFTNNLTAKIEGLYVNFGSKGGDNNNGGSRAFVLNGTTFTAANTFALDSRRDTEFAVVRAGLNYKFSMN